MRPDRLPGPVVGPAAGWLGAWSLDRPAYKACARCAAEITAAARAEAEKILKEAELKAKDELFQKREEFNREIEQARGELREQERRLEKREDGLEQKHQAQLKKERSPRAQPSASCTNARPSSKSERQEVGRRSSSSRRRSCTRSAA